MYKELDHWGSGKNTFYNVIILIKSVFNKNKNNYYCNIFLEKGSCEIPKNKDNK